MSHFSSTTPSGGGSEVKERMVRRFFVAGVVFAFLGVAAGALGAHALKSRISPGMLLVFETAVRYQMYHALALLVTAWATERWSSPWFQRGGYLFVVGILLFSGSLYALVLSGYTRIGIVTPLGGLALLAGWFSLGWGAMRRAD